MYIHNIIALNSSQNDKCLRKTLYRNQTHFVFNIVVSESHAVYEIMWRNMVGPDRQQTTKLHEEKDANWMPDS
jgi:tRNA A22 N-methylase